MYGELYLAGPFEARNVIRKFADEAERFCKITSSWVYINEVNMHITKARYAANDLMCIERCKTFVLITENEPKVAVELFPKKILETGGRYTELGYALALKKHIVLIGKTGNIFVNLANVFAHYANWDVFMRDILNNIEWVGPWWPVRGRERTWYRDTVTNIYVRIDGTKLVRDCHGKWTRYNTYGERILGYYLDVESGMCNTDHEVPLLIDFKKGIKPDADKI